jgi:hypothetical protein
MYLTRANTLAYYNYTRLHMQGRILALTANVRLGWMCLTGANTLAYCNFELITVVKNLTRLYTKGRILALIANI